MVNATASITPSTLLYLSFIFCNFTTSCSTNVTLYHNAFSPSLHACTIKTRCIPHHGRHHQQTAHSRPTITRMRPGIIVVIVFGSLLVTILLAILCTYCIQWSRAVWEVFFKNDFQQRRRKRTIARPTTTSPDLELLLRRPSVAHLTDSDAVSLSGVTVCGTEEDFEKWVCESSLGTVIC